MQCERAASRSMNFDPCGVTAVTDCDLRSEGYYTCHLKVALKARRREMSLAQTPCLLCGFSLVMLVAASDLARLPASVSACDY